MIGLIVHLSPRMRSHFSAVWKNNQRFVSPSIRRPTVQIPLWETESRPDTIQVSSPSVCLEMQGIRIEIHEQAGTDVIRNTLLALRQLC